MKKIVILVLFILVWGVSITQVSNNELILRRMVPQGPGLSGPANLEILLFGNGGLRKSATGSSGSDNPSNGSLGASFLIKGKTDLTVGFTINSFKTIEVSNAEDFGNNLLIPDLGGSSFSLAGTKYINKKIGIYGELLIADSKWKIDTIEYETSPLSFKFGANITPFGNIPIGDNFIILTFYAGYSNRTILGNLSNKDEVRFKYFGTKQKAFHGLELGASLLLNQTRVFINVPVLFGNQDIDGLTGGQVILGATISGNLLKF